MERSNIDQQSTIVWVVRIVPRRFAANEVPNGTVCATTRSMRNWQHGGTPQYKTDFLVSSPEICTSPTALIRDLRVLEQVFVRSASQPRQRDREAPHEASCAACVAITLGSVSSVEGSAGRTAARGGL